MWEERDKRLYAFARVCKHNFLLHVCDKTASDKSD